MQYSPQKNWIPGAINIRHCNTLYLIPIFSISRSIYFLTPSKNVKGIRPILHVSIWRTKEKMKNKTTMTKKLTTHSLKNELLLGTSFLIPAYWSILILWLLLLPHNPIPSPFLWLHTGIWCFYIKFQVLTAFPITVWEFSIFPGPWDQLSFVRRRLLKDSSSGGWATLFQVWRLSPPRSPHMSCQPRH